MKMDGSGNSGPSLEVSVSFGRFEHDALSWEKWSSFSPNKYLEEVGNLSTPGSVAQKKAYFEAHYKKIAAKKAEELEQEKLLDYVKQSPDVSIKEDRFGNSSENSTELVEEVAEEACMTALAKVAISDEANNVDARSSEGNEHGAHTNGFVDASTSEEENEGSSIALKCEGSAIEEAKDALNVNEENPEVNVRKDEVLVGLETPQKGSEHILEQPPERKNGIKKSSVSKKENSKLNTRGIASKVTPVKEKNLGGTKKKVVSPATKPLHVSTPKYAKPPSVSTPASASQASKKQVNGSAPPKSKSSQVGESKRAAPTTLHMSLKKQVNGSAPPKSKRSQVGETKRAAPTTLHMSLSLGPADSLGGALSMTRKSLIMERMGDKDIVKRAFKTFQNRTINGSTTDEKSITVKNASSTTAFERKMPIYRTSVNGNEGLRKDAEKRGSQMTQLGTRSNHLSSGSKKSSGLDKKSTTAISPAASLKSDEKAEKRREFLNKFGARSMAREAKYAQHGAKSKVHQQPIVNRQ